MAVLSEKGGGLKDSEFPKGSLKMCPDSGETVILAPAHSSISVCMKERDWESQQQEKNPKLSFI